jgi:hypothetical protein
MMGTIHSNDENRASFWVKVTVMKPLPTGRQAFGLRVEGYVKFFKTNNLTE